MLIEDEHPDPVPEVPITAIPAGGAPGQFLPGVTFESLEGLFADPDALVFIGPGFLVENFQILDPNTATADVTISETVLPIDHLVVIDTPEFVRAGLFRITDCGPLTCLRDLNPPTGSLEFEPVSGAAFPVTLIFDDPDGDIVQAEIAIERLPSEEILAESPLRTYRTDVSDPEPEAIELITPILPPGDYVAIGILGDGLTDYVQLEVPFTIPPPIPTVSEWGLIVLTLLELTAGTIVIGRRRRAASSAATN